MIAGAIQAVVLVLLALGYTVVAIMDPEPGAVIAAMLLGLFAVFHLSRRSHWIDPPSDPPIVP